MMNKRDENKILNWERERHFGKWIYALINSALTSVTLYVLLGALNIGKIINIWYLTFENSYHYILPAFCVLYVVFLIQYNHSEEEYKQLLKNKEHENENESIE